MTIPAPWTDAVSQALQATFGVDAPDDVSPVSGGMSGAAVLRIGVQGRSYLMRLDPIVDGFGDPRHWHGCMQIAAAAGVAPKVHYAGASGVSIVDFVEQNPLQAYWSGDRTVLIADLGQLLRRLHDAPAFPPLFDYLDGMESLIATVSSSGALSAAELAVPLERFSAVSRAYRALQPQLVPGHNDVNPRNLVHDGTRLWLVDWVSAFQSDRYTDLASVAGVFAREDAEEVLFLEAYFGEPATPAQRARLYLARQINHMFYAMVMLTTAGGVRPERTRNLNELHLALRSGEPLLDSPAGRAEYALARLAAMIAGVEDSRFAEARDLAG